MCRTSFLGSGLLVGIVCWTIAACDDSATNGGGSGGTGGKQPPGPTCTDCTPAGPMTFALPSPAGATLWTTTTMDKVLREAAPPTATGAAIEISAARNEYEPFQLVVRPDATTTAKLSMTPFSGPGTIGGLELAEVGYVSIGAPSDPGSIPSGRVPDPLDPISFGDARSLGAGENQPYWITVFVPPDAPPGDYTSTLTVDLGGATSDVPVKLHVYDFALPPKIGFDGNWNASMEALGGGQSLEAVQRIKDHFHQHRLTPSSVAWPAGLNYDGGIDYDCATHQFIQGTGEYDFETLGKKYIDGVGWNGVGFPSFEIMQFVDNSTPRPAEFCGIPRGDAFGTAAYNAEWSKLLAAVDAELVSHGWTDKGYYYVENEPQGAEDYDVAAFLADLTKTSAPHLRIAVSEEPKPEIAENPLANGHSYDLWWADLSEFDPDYAKVRQAAGDDVWWYFLYGDLPPHFNPITIDHSGLESRIAYWAAWKYRIKGFAYYSVTGWGNDPRSNPRPEGTNQNGDGFLLYPPTGDRITSSIRWELLREGQEDYEYLLLANGQKQPSVPGTNEGCDLSVDSAVSSTTSFTHDTSALKHLRDQLGAFLGKEVNGCPKLESTSTSAHPKAPYYINFQDPAGQPDAPTQDGQAYLKIGWEAYDAKKGYGWSGPYIGDPTIMKFQYLSDAPVDELQRSIIFNDYGRTDTFNWDIEPGTYDVTVSIGWYDKTYSKQRVVVEGQVMFDDFETNPSAPYAVKTVTVDASDGNVTLEIGQTDEYTMLNWMTIVPK
ncbi:MAG: DUF4091 domain-containing protein [Polyangiaceae bacterium]